MLTQIRIQCYKSLYDVRVDLEPFTVFIGPNGSGKSNICEALFVFSNMVNSARGFPAAVELLPNAHNKSWRAKFWQGDAQKILFSSMVDDKSKTTKHEVGVWVNEGGNFKATAEAKALLSQAIAKVAIYDFSPATLAKDTTNFLQSTGEGIANTLGRILYDNRSEFDELELRFTQLVPNISRISLEKGGNRDLLRLVDKYSEHRMPAQDISDGTLRILGFLSALYDVDRPDIFCFEEPENGVHPWLLHKMVELLTLVSTEGIGGKPVQVLITTHSPVLLNYIKPEQVRVVELDQEGKTQIHPLPTDSAHLQAAMDAYENQIGELWFTDVIGGNPS